MKVLKFGGSSVANRQAVEQVLSILKQAVAEDNEAPVMVVSALGGVTDQLQEAAEASAAGKPVYKSAIDEIRERHKELLEAFDVDGDTLETIDEMLESLEDVLHGVYLVRELTTRTLDVVLSFGERLSACTLTACLSGNGIAARYVDARELIQTDRSFGHARILWEVTQQQIQEYFKNVDEVSVVTGFIASTKKGETTTLGRGGSDYTASVVAVSLQADVVEIWTDVEGVMTADPRKVEHHYPIPRLSYEEAMELSHFGAKVIFPPTMQPVMKAGIPIRIRNTFKPEEPGTLISSEFEEDDKSPIKGISSIDEVALLTIRGSGMVGVSGIASRIFKALADAGINIIMITQASSEHTVCLAVLPQQAERARKALKREFRLELNDQTISEVMLERDLSVIAVVSDKMRHTPGIAGKVFSALGHDGINVIAIAQGSSERNISVVVDRNNEVKALNALHDAFFLSGVKTIHLFLVGVGLIGSKLLELIEKQMQTFYDDYWIDLRLTGVANSKKMLIDGSGIQLNEWQERLDKEGNDTDMEAYAEKIRELNKTNSIFVDCTASAELPRVYSGLLQSSVSVVTPNKKANSGPMSFYRQLQSDAIRHNVAFRYETNVGAGLPIVATFHEQASTGDTVRRVEGVLSGTLSYLFNNFDGSEPFSELVRQAREKGYTEPDPREDLNGHDVARKLLILAREAGYELEFDDIEIENLVPEPAREVDTVDEFFEVLAEHDEVFEKRYREAADKNCKLCYIAHFEPGKARVGLEQLSAEHPFYSLSGSDNIVALHSDHYSETPMVVKGPGAGANVTASGVIADILRIANTAGQGHVK